MMRRRSAQSAEHGEQLSWQGATDSPRIRYGFDFGNRTCPHFRPRNHTTFVVSGLWCGRLRTILSQATLGFVSPECYGGLLFGCKCCCYVVIGVPAAR